jgi:hypothetical protein
VRRQAKALIWRNPAKFFAALLWHLSTDTTWIVRKWSVDRDLLRVEALSDNLFAVGMMLLLALRAGRSHGQLQTWGEPILDLEQILQNPVSLCGVAASFV